MQSEPVSYEKIWRAALGELEIGLSQANFNTWFRGTFISRVDGSTVVIGSSNAFAPDWLAKKYQTDILTILRKLLPEQQITELVFTNTRTEQPSGSARTELVSVEPSVVREPGALPANPGAGGWELNPDYTFNNFIVGTHNRLAHAAGLAIASEPGKRHNPFVIYGGVGLGKTHLIQAIGNEIRKNHPRTRILYSSCEKFANEFIQAIQTKRTEAFKEKYRSVDVLLIDDIQFLSGKEGTQEEFFHTFNALHQTNRQIILTSDRMPQAIPELEARLSSRFVWGMVTDIKNPDLETRAAILQQKALQRGLHLDAETIDLIARTYHNNIRELEGGLNHVLAVCELEKVEPGRALVERLLREHQPQRKVALSADQIYAAVSDHFHVAAPDLFGARRHKELVYPRQILMYLLRHELSYSFPKIGRELRKDHTTVMHGVEKIEHALPKDIQLQEEISRLKDRLYNQA